MALRKPSDFFEDKNKNGVSESIKDTESFDTFQSYKKNIEKFDAISKFSGSLEDYNENVERVNYLSQQLLGVQEEIKTLLTQEDLDRAMMSQLLVVEETTKDIQSRVKTINNEKLADVRKKVERLTEQVNQFISIDVPKYKSLVIDSEKRAYSRYDKFEGRISESIETVQQSIDDVRSSVDEKYEEINENISDFQDKLTNKVSSVKKTVGKFIEEEKVNISANQIKVRQELENFENKLKEISVDVFESSEDNKNFKSEITGRVNNFFESSNSTFDKNVKEIEDFKQELSNKVNNLEVDLIRNESHIKVQNESLDKIQVDVREAIEKLKIDELEEKNASLARKVNYIQEVLEKFSEREVLTESITEPPATNNSDPLTPTDQNFVTFDQLQSHYRLFINRIQNQLSTLGGGGETRLKYLDDIVGIATNPSVYDGKFLKYDHSARKFEFSQATAVATGVAEDGIVYVAKDGNDSNAGTLTEPKLTIKAAVDSIVSAGVTDRVVRVAPGTYIEDNPIILPDEVTVIGQSLRETTIIPQNDDQDLFYVGNGNYIAEMSFRGSLPNKAIVAFDPTKPRYINQSPYIQNCTNFIPDSIGIKIDGNAAIGPTKSMVLDSYTQYNQGGIGASITNQGYAQLVSLFTICDDIAIYCGNGGACDLTNSNSSFGNYGLVADGVSPKKYSGIITSPSASLSDTFVVDLSTPELSVSNAVYDNVSGIVTITTSLDHNFNVGMGVSITGLGFTCSSGPGIVTYPSGNKGYTFNVNQVVSSNEFSAYVGVSTLQHTYVSGGTVKTEVVRPYDGLVIYFNDLYNTVKTIAITDGGSGYTSPPIVTIDAPSASWGVGAKAIATIENGSVTQIDMLSNGRGYTTAPNITFSAPQTGINTAIGVAVMTPEYYTINKSTEISNGISTITLNENVPFAVGVGTTVNFFKQSRILTTGHSFEFIGSGTDIANSIPFNGGSPPIPENETDSRNGGLVVYTSTNQSGNFKIGDGVTINQNTSSITGQAYEKSLVSTMTPYILSLGAL